MLCLWVMIVDSPDHLSSTVMCFRFPFNLTWSAWEKESISLSLRSYCSKPTDIQLTKFSVIFPYLLDHLIHYLNLYSFFFYITSCLLQFRCMPKSNSLQYRGMAWKSIRSDWLLIRYVGWSLINLRSKASRSLLSSFPRRILFPIIKCK